MESDTRKEMKKMEECNCPGWTWEEWAVGARGGHYPACQNCGKAIPPKNDDSHRYFYAKLERWCTCQNPVYPRKKEYHQVWCSVWKKGCEQK
jgi:hypothetical protein